ncbi:UvrD-helicase domain-containing protein [Microcella indica]|uniref:UvrD-helicase domain-containing protein n=1 Tax=Microcella indica TaxID=2750620 RepID=UPI0015CF348D
MIHLTDEQVLAAASEDRLVDIVSAPGSGKTTVAAERFGFHRYQRGDDRGVLGLTFNRAAARELAQRVGLTPDFRSVRYESRLVAPLVGEEDWIHHDHEKAPAHAGTDRSQARHR